MLTFDTKIKHFIFNYDSVYFILQRTAVRTEEFVFFTRMSLV